MGTEFVAETSEKLHILTRLSARENVIEDNLCPYFVLSTLERSDGFMLKLVLLPNC